MFNLDEKTKRLERKTWLVIFCVAIYGISIWLAFMQGQEKGYDNSNSFHEKYSYQLKR